MWNSDPWCVDLHPQVQIPFINGNVSGRRRVSGVAAFVCIPAGILHGVAED